MRRAAAITFAVSMLATAALADSYDTARQLGTVLGSEAECDLSYDHMAIVAFIKKNVARDDMVFPDDLADFAEMTEYAFKDMSASSKVAHCTQIERIAKTLNFVD